MRQKNKKRRSAGHSVSYFFVSCFISLLTFFVLNPFAFLDFRFFIQELHQQSTAEGAVGFLHHLTYSLNGGVGLPVLFLGCLGMAKVLINADLKRCVLLSFVVVYYLVLCF